MRPVTVYEEYAIFLRGVSRANQAAKMEQRAKVLREIYPDYKPGERY